SHYSESNIYPDTFRKVSPGSQTPYVKPDTENSAIFNNQYFNRDMRRNYPRLAVYTQQDVGQLLLAAHQAESLTGPAAVKAKEAIKPGAASGEAKAEVAKGEEGCNVPAIEVRDVVDALAKVGKPLYTPSNLPPMPGTARKFELSKYQMIEQPGQYYPMYKVY
ncbi:hypothetical protein EV182_006084, partial [Spiromyces aspiralis]